MTATTDQKLSIVETWRSDPDVRLPADVQTAIARGEAAFKNQSRHADTRVRDDDGIPEIITSVVDQSVQDRRDANLDAREQPTKGRRRQPPMIGRLRAVMIVVDRFLAERVRLRVGPNSRMNKSVRKWLNIRASRSLDPRTSRRKQISGTAVRELLKQVRAEGEAVARKPAQRRRTTQEEARERLKELLSRRAASTD
jgi:hypothetical protein